MKVDSVTLNSSETLWSQDRESDDSEDDETSPTKEYWAIPDDGWTLVERSHGQTRGISDRYQGRSDNSDEKLAYGGSCDDELDDIMDTKVLSNFRKEVVQIADTFPETTTDIRTVRVDVKPIVIEQPDRLEGMLINKSDGRDDCLVNLVLGPRRRESECSDEITRMTARKAVAHDDVIMEPVPWLLSEEVVEETAPDESTFEEYTDEPLVKDETTKRDVSMELMDLPLKLMTRGFLELAEEARLVDVSLSPSCGMNDIIQQITGRKDPMSEDKSWRIEEVMERSVDAFCNMAMKVPTAKFDMGQLMQWPNVKSTGMMICEFTLESEMFYHGPVRREAEPVFVAAESEVFTPVFTGGFLAETGPLVAAEAVTSRVSALPAVGSDIQTGLSTAVGREDRSSLSSGDYLDKVGHGAGRSEARTVPVEHLSLFSAVYNVMPPWIRPLVVQTSRVFLSDEREEVEMPLCERDDQPVRTRKLYIHDVDTDAQMTKETHGVGPTGDRWDGLGMLDTWYMGCLWRKTQIGDTERLLRGSPCASDLGKETGPVSRKRQSVFDVDWLDGHLNRRGGSVETGTDVTVAQYCYLRRPALPVWKHWRGGRLWMWIRQLDCN